MPVRTSPAPPWWRWLAVLPVLGCLGCSGGGLNPVKGQLLIKGQPVKGAVVTFHPKEGSTVKTIPSVGTTDADGNFTMMTGTKEGAPAGEYLVTVYWPEEAPKKGMSTEMPETRDKLKGAYSNPASSGLKASVKSGPNQLDPIQLK